MNDFKFWSDHFNLSIAKTVIDKEMPVINQITVHREVDYIGIASLVAMLAIWGYIGYKTIKGGRELWLKHKG